MTCAAKFQFPKLEPFTFTWTVTDGSTPPNPITDCHSVIATLYAGRSTTNPDTIPGTPVPEFSSVSLSGDGHGNYSADIGDDGGFNPLAGNNYVVVIDATDAGGDPLGHWEEGVAIVVNS